MEGPDPLELFWRGWPGLDPRTPPKQFQRIPLRPGPRQGPTGPASRTFPSYGRAGLPPIPLRPSGGLESGQLAGPSTPRSARKL